MFLPQSSQFGDDTDDVAVPSSSTPVLQPLPTSSSRTPIHNTHESRSPCRVAASPGWQRSPFRNRPSWSRFKTPPPPPRHRLHAVSDNTEPTLAASEPSSENAKTLVDRSANSTGPLEAVEQQRTNRTRSAINTSCSDEFLNSLAESSGRTPASTTASALSFPTLADDKLAIARMANITITKIIDERIGSSGLQYKCELKPVWVPVNLVEKAQMGPACIGSYKNRLIRAERLGTLRSRKRRRSQNRGVLNG